MAAGQKCPCHQLSNVKRPRLNTLLAVWSEKNLWMWKPTSKAVFVTLYFMTQAWKKLCVCLTHNLVALLGVAGCYPLNLSISVSGGRKYKRNLPRNSEWKAKTSPPSNLLVQLCWPTELWWKPGLHVVHSWKYIWVCVLITVFSVIGLCELCHERRMQALAEE